MPCAVAVPPNTPIFSSPRLSPIFYKSPTIHGPQSPFATSSPSSPLDGNNGALLKRKRTARIFIPVVGVLGFGLDTPKVTEVEWYEAEEYGYSVVCKKGKHGALENRCSTFVHSNQGGCEVVLQAI